MAVAEIPVSRFGLRDGHWDDDPSGARCVTRPSEEGLFVALVQIEGPGSIPEGLYDDLFRAMEDAWLATEGGPIRRVRAAAAAANSRLFERNVRADGNHQAWAGVACALVLEDQVYLSLLGPLVALGEVGGMRFLEPEGSPWLGPGEVVNSPRDWDTAGRAGLAEPLLYRADLSSPGDYLALVPAQAVRVAPDEALRQAVGGSGTPEDLESLGLGDMAIVRFGEGVPSPQDQRAAEGRGGLIRVYLREEAEVQTGSSGSLEGVAADQARPEEGRHTAPVPGTERIVEEAVARRRLALPRPDVVRLRRALVECARRWIYRMEDALVKVLPDQVPERPPKATRKKELPVPGKALVFLAMAIPVVLLGVVIATRLQYEASRRDQFVEIQARAQAYYDQATTAPDVATMRQNLEDALATVQEGLAIQPGDEMLQSLLRRIEHTLDQINVVERVYTFYKLAELGEATRASSDASRIVVEGDDLFVLHKGSDRVFKYVLNEIGDALQSFEADPTLISQGETYDGVQAAHLVDIAWMLAGGQRTLSTFVVMDRAGTMFAFDPQIGFDALPVADSDTWLQPEAIGGYFGNLYVLDPLLNVILKYIPVDNAYTSPPTSYLDYSLGIDLTGAVDMAIDGNVYVLFADGQVLKFYDGAEMPFTMAGLPSPMRHPTAIFVSGQQEPDAQGYVYVADTANQRIVQFDKEGNYVRQLKAGVGGKEMEDLRGLHVDEEKERLLLVSDDALWYGRLPPLAPR